MRSDKLAALACVALAAVLGGCEGSSLGGYQVIIPPQVQFGGWDFLSTDSCSGWVDNVGFAASNVRLQLWYATASGESSRVVNIGAVGDFSRAPFRALPQITQGEPRFPRAGQVTWDGGSWPAEPQKPVVWFDTWCWTAPDSLQGRVRDYGGWAYHVVLTLVSRDGLLDYSPPLGRLGTSGDWSFRSAARESSGSFVQPIVLKIRWEDYGGIRDSVVSPPIERAVDLCYGAAPVAANADAKGVRQGRRVTSRIIFP